jgi:hypothetical protein
MNLIVMGSVGTGPLVLVGLLVCWVSGAAESGQAPTNGVRVARVSPPLPSATAAQFDYFRQLLKAKGQEREKLLASKSKPEHQKTLRSYLSLYDGLTPEECEDRIRAMELRTIMVTLLKLAPSNRVESVKLVSERDRPMVKERLRIWETFSTEEQNDVLTNEPLIRIITGGTGGARREGVALSVTASNQLKQVEPQVQWWRALPESRRTRIQQNFTDIFELTDAEKAKQKLEPLPFSPEDRTIMERTLVQFHKLPPIQRVQCVQGFGKFAELTPAERRQFLANAEEWKKMPAEDREKWRKLVTKMPPLPPGLGQPPLPRAPASLQPRAPVTALLTNN